MLESELKANRVELQKMKRFYEDAKTELARAYEEI